MIWWLDPPLKQLEANDIVCMLSYEDAHGDYVFNVFKERNASVETLIQRGSILLLICKGCTIFIPFHENLDAKRGDKLTF